MPVNIKRFEKELDQFKNYRELRGEYRDKIGEVLKVIHTKSGATISELKREGIVWTPLLYVIMGWLEDRWLAEKERQVGRGRPRLRYKLTERGKTALLSLWTRQVESLVLRVDGRREGTVRIMIPERTQNGKTDDTAWRAQRLGADRLESLFRLVTTDPPFLSVPFTGRGAGESLMIVKDLEQNPDLEPLEEEIWSYCRHMIISDLEFAQPEVDRIIERFFDFDSLRLPDESCMDQDLQLARAKYRKYWVRRLEEVPETGELLPDWAGLLRGKGTAVQRMRRYIGQRLEKNPNYVLPSPLWLELDFDVPREFIGEISFPYNATITEPACAKVVSDVLWTFQQMASQTPQLERDGEGRNYPDTGLLRGDSLSGFIPVLEEYQRSREFYEAWAVLRELPWMIEKRKEEDMFGSVERAVLRYIRTGEFCNLARVYSELAQGKLKTFEEASKAVEAGDYLFSK